MPEPRHSSFAGRLVLAAALLAATCAHAADKPASFGKGKAGGPLLTRAELRECLAQTTRIRNLSDEAAKLQAALEADKAEITRLDAARKDKLATLDRSSAEAVSAYNAEGQVLDQLIDAYNARTPAFNAKVDALQTEREGFAKGCDNRNYDEKDETAIKNGK
jgi:septal ring factor EnvC (AmiA/AmiB activator)